MDQAGRIALGRHPQRHHRPSGRAGSRRRGEIRTQFSHVIDIAATVLDAAGPARAELRARHPADADPGTEHASLIRRRVRPGASRDAVLRDVREPRDLPPGLDRGDTAQHPVGHGRAAAARRRRWELYGAGRLDPGPRPRRGAARSTSRPAASVPDRGDQVQRAPARRPPCRAVQPGSRRSPEPDPRQHPGPVRRHGSTVRELRRQHQEQVHAVTAHIEVPEGPRRTASSSRKAVRSAAGSLYANDGRPAYCYNLFGLQQFKTYGDATIPAGEHQVRMEFAYDGGGLAKGGTVTSTSTGRRSARAGSMRRYRWPSPPTRPPTSAPTPPRRSATTTGPRTAASTGRMHWVQIDLDEAAEDLDHLITPDERYRLAMARQ